MISCCWNAHVMWNRNWAKSMQHIVLFVFPFFCADFSRNKYIYGRLIKLKNTFFLCQKSVSWLFFVVPERKIIKFIHKIFVILSQTQKTIELLHLENALPVIGKSVFCFGRGGQAAETHGAWHCHSREYTLQLKVFLFYLNNHGKYRHKTKQVYAGDRTLQSWSMVWVVSCMFTD